jgi:hypothetical protein
MDDRKLRIIQPHLFDLMDLPRTWCTCGTLGNLAGNLGKWMDPTPSQTAGLQTPKEQKYSAEGGGRVQ